ncbi:RecB family exonuclease [Pseudonocardia bannensis]|uniref:PD-(D/E)XK nuclease family protein n=1 Tax=Pseudonocardia bannensis TaxID=630973 RepID=A0A848DM82_9PSEU|nr:PD-(D/E)XK nuclease family protein [Pseudonocardia bannensis]NMH93606.1 PD-(D/E)XK nuclease family protein [Pseudonocardia bannensis]
MQYGDGGQLGLDFGADFATRPLVRVTPARLATWSACPRRYRMTYLDRPAPVRGGAWAHNSLGAVVHLALRSLFELVGPARTPQAAAALVDRHWSGEGFRDREQAAVYRERARGWLADYAADLGDDLADAQPIGLERWVSAPVGAIVAEGRVDRIDARGGELVIVDYKTGRHLLDVDDARDSQALALYALAAQRALHRPCTQVELHHLPTGRVLAWQHDDASLRAHLERAETTAAQADDAAQALARGGDPEELFPPRPSPRCVMCDLRRHCPEGRAAGPAAEPWAFLAP